MTLTLQMKVKVRFGWFNWDFLKVGDETASWCNDKLQKGKWMKLKARKIA